jgi:predicted GH43/DUF377 family glycosyl hydrolase
LVLYHGASPESEYSLALTLLDRQNPDRILDRSTIPLLSPELSWEREGFFPNVVFSNGWVKWFDTEKNEDRIWVYYGAADDGVGLAELTRND